MNNKRFKIKVRQPDPVKDFWYLSLCHLNTMADEIDVHILLASWYEDEAEASRHIQMASDIYDMYSEFKQELFKLPVS